MSRTLIRGGLVIGPVKTRAGKRDLPLLGLAEEALMIRRGVQFPDCEQFGSAWTDTGLDVDVTGGAKVPQLIVPYTLDTNDMRFASPQGFNTADHFFTYLRDAFDVLYEEGDEAPKMLSIGMHCRLLGRPGRLRALQRFLDHIEQHDRVWVTRRVDIARHWREHHPYQQNHRGAAA